MPSHYLNQCWDIFNCTLRNELLWNFNQNTKLFVHENAFENIVYEMVVILPRGRWVNWYGPSVAIWHDFLLLFLEGHHIWWQAEEAPSPIDDVVYIPFQCLVLSSTPKDQDCIPYRVLVSMILTPACWDWNIPALSPTIAVKPILKINIIQFLNAAIRFDWCGITHCLLSWN